MEIMMNNNISMCLPTFSHLMFMISKKSIRKLKMYLLS